MSHPFIADPHLRCIFPLERKMLSHVSDSFQSEHSESDCSRCESLNKSDVNSASAHTCIYFLFSVEVHSSQLSSSPLLLSYL